MKKQKGITLIALVITIIVLLILAGVAISMLSGENGISRQAANAKTETEKASDLEKVQLAVTSALTEGLRTLDIEDTTGNTKGSLYKALEADGITGYTGNGVVKYNGKTYVISENGNVTTITFSKISTGDLAIGSEVTASNGEKFYVIGFSADNTKVNLLAKYNLKKEGNEITLKQDTTEAINPCVFSRTNYWSSVSGIAYPDANGKYPDLNDEETYPIPSDATSIVTTAKAYGESLGATGRLMTVGEVVDLGGSTSNYSTSGCPAFINTQAFWLGSAYNGEYVWAVGDFNLDACYYYMSRWYGVRPVIEILKSSIE